VLGLDFETEAIGPRPQEYPPKPVGLALETEAGESRYLAWGHPSGNNCTFEEAKQVVGAAWESGEEILCHNSKFDYEVAMAHFGMPELPPTRLHDTQFMLFLTDPHAPNLALKASAARVLGLPPEERDVLQDWILRNVPGATKKEWGAHISKAPASIVGPYACGDTKRTVQLWQKLWPVIKSLNMEQAYQREQRLMPILMRAEQKGLRVDLPLLARDIDRGRASLEEADDRIRKILNAPGLNVDSDAQLASVLAREQVINGVVYTEKGAISMAKGALRATITNPALLTLLLYRNALQTCLSTFAEPWMAQATAAGGRLHPQWNQVRGDKAGGFRGTRTGRLSCEKPNLTNPPNEIELETPPGLMPIMALRRYLLPEEGEVWLKRDFSSQEIRVLAHYEDGALMRAYQENPKLDPHEMAKGLIQQNTGLDLPRRDVKISAFSIIYGAGVTGLAAQLGTTSEHARRVREAYYAALPGIRLLGNGLRDRGRQGLAIRTLGGRMYYSEKPRLIKGVMRGFEYKLLNYLIQGSAADQTKQSVIEWAESNPTGATFLAAIHDEINISASPEKAEEAMMHLRETMNAPRLDVPVLTDGYVGPNFQDLEKTT
jgi:DNA polymerase I-like protein with 3'-5' exonuclease and polymerase domains